MGLRKLLWIDYSYRYIYWRLLWLFQRKHTAKSKSCVLQNISMTKFMNELSACYSSFLTSTKQIKWVEHKTHKSHFFVGMAKKVSYFTRNKWIAIANQHNIYNFHSCSAVCCLDLDSSSHVYLWRCCCFSWTISKNSSESLKRTIGQPSRREHCNIMWIKQNTLAAAGKVFTSQKDQCFLCQHPGAQCSAGQSSTSFWTGQMTRYSSG